MKTENKQKLSSLLSELYDNGETTGEILEVVLHGLADSERIEEINTLLANSPRDYNYHDMVGELVEEIANKKDYNAAALLHLFDEDQVITQIKDSEKFNKIVVDYVIENEDIRDEITWKSGNNVIIPSKMLTADKKSKIEEFLESIFPYYNDQQQIKINFML